MKRSPSLPVAFALIALLFAIGSATGRAQQPASSAPAPPAIDMTPVKPESVGFSPERLDRLHAAIQEEIDQKHLAGAVTILARHGKIAGSIAFLFSSAAIRAVGRSVRTIVQEVRRQFREHPGIMDRTERPDYSSVIDICTKGALRELVTLALLAVLAPVVIGFGISDLALGGFFAWAILRAS